MRKFYWFICLIKFLIVLILLNSCEYKSKSDVVSEGVITYDITYFETEQENPLISLLPSQMTVSFKDDIAISEFEGWMGIFKTCLITNLKKERNYTLLKMSDKKYFYSSSINDPFFGYGMNDFTVQFNENSQKEIAGFACDGGVVSFSKSEKKSFDIFFTNAVKIKHPNINNPFKEINGVLMEFNLEINNIEMKLTFNNLKEEELSNDLFKVPRDYKEVDKEEIEKILKSVNFD